MARELDPRQFPTRRDLRAELGNVLPDVRSLGSNQGSRKYDELSGIYESESDIWYAPSPKASSSAQRMQDEGNPNSVAFVDTDIPTSSTNYSRPRTVAAGYDPERQTMTVVFRDGTFYNYYEVSAGEWQAFKASVSKGNPWLNRRNKNQSSDGLFLNKPRGVADVSSISAEVRELLYRVVRSQQIYRTTKLNRGKFGRSTAIRKNAALGASARKRQGRNPSQR